MSKENENDSKNFSENVDDSITQNENIELNGNIITCFIGKKESRKRSSKFASEIKDTNFYDEAGKGYVQLGNEKYLAYFPLFRKSIKIISSKGFQYKAEIYFVEDIKNIISFFTMKNPSYLVGVSNDFVQFNKSEYSYSRFLLNKNINIIKDIVVYNIDYTYLEDVYKKKSLIKEQPKKFLNEINDNISYYYQKFSSFLLENEKIIFSTERNSLINDIYAFYYGQLDKMEKEKIIGLFGNYASGKSISLILFNFSCNFPSLYLNLKILKNTLQTEAYSKIFPNEAMNIFIKSKKTFNEFENYIKRFYETIYINLDKFIYEIIDNFKEINGIIFLDQFSNELFNDSKKFLVDIKSLLYEENNKLKIIVINSMNDQSMRDTYKSYKLSCFSNGKQDFDIKYLFVENLINKSNLPIEKDIEKNLKLFNFLPLYNFLLLKNKNNQDNIVSKTRTWIKNKIESFLDSNNKNGYIFQINEIRLKIDEKISKEFFLKYFDYIPLKYFYINQDNILKCYFPLVNEVWNEIIYENSFSIFNGQIKYTGSIIGTFLELNFIHQLKKNSLTLKVDCVVELDTLYKMDKITNKNDTNLEGKNILITQKNENAKFFDVGYLNNTDIKNPKMIYIQIKKSSTDNKVTRKETYEVFENNKNRFNAIFGINPQSCYLIYITLYRNFFSKNLNELTEKELEILKSADALQLFCNNNNIQLYYFEPKNKLFYIKSNNGYNISVLNLLDENSKITENIDISLEYVNKKKHREFENSKN